MSPDLFTDGTALPHYNEVMAARKQYELLNPGAVAPDFRLARLEGGEVALKDLLSAGPVLLVFYKTTCPVCQMTLPYVQRIHEAAAMPIYAISQDDAADTRDFNREFHLTLPTLLDSEAAGFPASNAYGISHVPTFYLVAPDGKILRTIESWSKSEMESLGASVGVRVIQATDRVPEFRPG